MAGHYAEFVVNLNNIGGDNKPKFSKAREQKQEENNYRAIRGTIAVISKSASIINNQVGAYTGNKVKQQNIRQGIGIATAIAVSVINPSLGVTMLAGNTIDNTVSYITNMVNTQQETTYKTSLVGKMSTSGSRWRGENKWLTTHLKSIWIMGMV